MNESVSMSLRARINNFAKINKVSPQLALATELGLRWIRIALG